MSDNQGTQTEVTAMAAVLEAIGGNPVAAATPFFNAVLAGTLGQTFRTTDETTVLAYAAILLQLRDAVGIVSTEWNKFVWAEQDQGRMVNVPGTRVRREAKEEKAPTAVPSISDLLKKK